MNLLSMPERFVNLMFQIDTNRINSRSGLPNMNLLEAWAERDVIMLDMSEVAMREAVNGGDPKRVEKARSYIFSEVLATTEPELRRMQQIADILFPSGIVEQNERNDVEIVFVAGKYARTLVTNDGASRRQPNGILGNATRLKKEVGIEVCSDEAAVAQVRRRIAERDALCRRIADMTGKPVPDWVGQD